MPARASFSTLKKLVIIGSVVAPGILIISLLFRRPEPPNLKLIAGNWVQQDSLGSLVLRPGGKFHWRIYSQKVQNDGIPEDAAQWLYEGTWDVKDGSLVLSISFANARNTTNVEPVGTVDKFRVITVDPGNLEMEREGVTMRLHRGQNRSPAK